MITLATLNNATLQDIFEQAATHLLTQNEKSDKDGKCFYRIERAGKELKCAAGCFISDEEIIKVESLGANNSAWFSVISQMELLIDSDKNLLIRELQMIHDIEIPSNWRKAISILAEKCQSLFGYKLDTNFMLKL